MENNRGCLTEAIVKQYQLKIEQKTTIGEFKEIGRELRDKFGLIDREAIDLLNNKNILNILAKYE